MEQETKLDFIVIDDDPMNNIICRKMIELTVPGATVNTFTLPREGLAYILATFSINSDDNAILFLDINMPVLNGWEVLEKFSEFPEMVKKKVKIYMLSSSVDLQDKENAENNPFVSGYITKSISQAKLRALFPN